MNGPTHVPGWVLGLILLAVLAATAYLGQQGALDGQATTGIIGAIVGGIFGHLSPKSADR